MNNYIIQKLEKENLHKLAPLVKDCFDTDFNLDYFHWKFLDNPAGKFVGFIAISESGEVGSYYGVIPEVYVIDGKLTTIYQSCDTMTHSKHRRRGLFQKLAKCCYDYLYQQNKLLVIGFSGRESTPGFLKFGWRVLFSMHYYFYPKIFSYFNFNKSYLEVHEIHDFKLIESVVMRSNQNAMIHIDKTLDCFKWRLRNPKHLYKVVSVLCNGNYESYLVYYLDQDKIILFDFYFANLIDGRKLITYLKNKLRTSNLKAILAFCQEHSMLTGWLDKLGFLVNPLGFGLLSNKTPFILYSSSNNLGKFINPNCWQINAFDHDAL